MKPNLSQVKKFVRQFTQHGSLKAVSRKCGMSYYVVHDLYEAAVAEKLMDPMRPGRKTKEHIKKVIAGSLTAKPGEQKAVVVEGHLRAKGYKPLPRKTKGVTRFLFTCAQNNTPVHDKFWANLLAFRDYIGATIHVSQFAYIKKGLGASGDKMSWLNNEKYTEAKDIYFDQRILPYAQNGRVEVAPGLVFCGDQNILPTAARPLSGFEVFTGRASGIFPHVKFQMDSIATVNSEEATKFNYTTGTVTMRNYIVRKEGMKAEFHHCYGALLVEVTESGDWFVRQVNADSDGSFYEFDVKGDGCVLVKDGEVNTGHRAEALTAGDVHARNLDPTVRSATWESKKSLVNVLKPKYQFIHDVLDFESRSHHNIKNPHYNYLLHVKERESVEDECSGVADFLSDIHRPWMQTVVVDSNHDRHLGRYLQEQNGLKDPINAPFWVALQKATYDAMYELGEEPNHLELALELVAPGLLAKKGILMLPGDGSYIICPEHGGGIECGLHGDRGPNGSRGSRLNIARMGRKANIGHSHSAGITDGVYQSGTSSKLRLAYNAGPSSWSHSHIVTYPNGKRTIVTIWNGQWRAA